jgi:molybdopterin/thiamine biosynthesis adenylyltransferase
MNFDRFERSIRFFGLEGQKKLSRTRCAVVGVGGVGMHVVQQLALYGVGRISPIDSEELATTDKNRNVAARHDDAVPGYRKVDLAERLINSFDPSIEVRPVFDSFISDAGLAEIREADWVIGSIDCEGGRLILTEFCSAYSKPYIDLATDINPDHTLEFGGRVCVSINGQSCLSCMDVLDRAEAGRDLAGELETRDREAIYGVPDDALGTSGPSVVSLNGTIASLGLTEFMVAVTGVRPPRRLLTFYGSSGKVTASVDEPFEDCLYCKGIWGRAENADVERHIRSGLGTRLR